MEIDEDIDTARPDRALEQQTTSEINGASTSKLQETSLESQVNNTLYKNPAAEQPISEVRAILSSMGGCHTG